jgi:signal transduction histidine kinase|nr:conserved Plasmodium protein [uncultured Mediterranean phage uvMED]|tara:strand:+ start:115 stop:633 length:519 start_codon:yes stop_codon:yes gene_type:complete
MAEVSFGGVSFKGGRIVVIITALTTLIGAMWGGFEFYKDYLNMKDKIQSYSAPDLSGFDKRLELVSQKSDVLQQEISMIIQEVQLVSDVANELKNDLRQDVRRIERIVNDVEQMIKEDSRENARELKDTIQDIKEDMVILSDKLEKSMNELEEKIEKRIKLALENPLSGLNG